MFNLHYFIGMAAHLIMYISSPGQTVEQIRIDSMLKILPGKKDDTNKVKLLTNISGTYWAVNPDKGIEAGRQAQLLAERLNWKVGVAGSYHALGANYWAKNQMLQAQKSYWSSLKEYEAAGDKHGMANNFHDLGLIYETQHDRSKALEYYSKALNMHSELGNKSAAMGCLGNIANVYEYLGKYDSALVSYTKALRMSQASGDNRGIGFMLRGIGRIYTYKKDYKKALEYENKSLKILERLDNKIDVANLLEDIGFIYQSEHNNIKAIEYFERGITILKSVKTNRARVLAAKNLDNLGQFYYFMATAPEAGIITKRIKKLYIQKTEKSFNEAIFMARVVNDKETITNCYKLLSAAQAIQGNYVTALKSYKLYDIYKDSLDDTKKEKEMSLHEIDYKNGKEKDSLNYVNKLQQSELQTLVHEKKLASLTRKQQLLYSIIILAILCLIGFYIFFQSRTKQLQLKNQLFAEKAEQQLKETQYQKKVNDITFSALRSQMNPHFIFNALNTIQSYVYSNDKRTASYYLGKFSELIRKILDYSDKQKITLEEEIHVLQLYIDLEKARFGDNFIPLVEINPALDAENIFLPPMLIQPYAENAIKHGLLHLSGLKRLLIHIDKSADGEYIKIVIDDNGIGRDKSMQINQKRIDHYSFANAANERRIDLINKIEDKKTQLEIIDKKNIDGTSAGTTVIISIPIISMAAELN